MMGDGPQSLRCTPRVAINERTAVGLRYRVFELDGWRCKLLRRMTPNAGLLAMVDGSRRDVRRSA